MKIIKTASGNKISISRKEWEEIGKKANWTSGKEWIDDPMEGYTETAPDPKLEKNKPESCVACGGNKIRWKAKWAGGEGKGKMGEGGWQCGECGHMQPSAPVTATIKSMTVVKAKKKKSPKEHGFMDQCMEENKDKKDPGAYCASIVDKTKGTTDWRKGPKD